MVIVVEGIIVEVGVLVGMGVLVGGGVFVSPDAFADGISGNRGKSMMNNPQISIMV
jgi:hypothetical protein